MSSLILRTVTRFIMSLLLLFAFFLLLRGHHVPGGGFSGGLVAAGGFALYTLAHDVRSARQVLHVRPQMLMGTGLFLAGAAGLLPVFQGRPFLTGLWADLDTLVFGKIALGTPLLFDLGVFLLVLGMTTAILFAFGEE